MDAVAESETGAKPRRRMDPETRREMILEAAVGYFADHGFEVQVRNLARDIGISPALVFKYFEGKDALIEAVYGAVFESRWKEEWERLISDRSVPFRERLVRFYDEYLQTVDDRNWIRIAMRASLDGSDLTRRYLADHVSHILTLIADEFDIQERVGEDGLFSGGNRTERIWHLHSTIIYYLIRKHIHQSPVMQDRTAFVRETVFAFLGPKRDRA